MRSIKLRVTGVIALVALLCMGGMVASAATDVKSKVKITEGGPDLFKGKVTSKNDKCLAKRKIRLEYAEGARKGEVVATTKTNDDGGWQISQVFYAGIYQVYVLQRAAQGLTCLGAHTTPAHF